MSPIAEQIRAAMSPVHVEAGEVRASFSFGRDFVGFQGHFPGRPILPGVCQIQAALVLLGAHLDRPVKLREIERARFSAPATCDERLDYHCAVKEGPDGRTTLRTTVRRGEVMVARFRLAIAIEEAGA